MFPRAPDGIPTPPPSVRGAPILVVAVLPPGIHVWADALRRAHYPPGRNRLGAHVTLFHGLPPSADIEVRAMLADIAARNAPPEARITGLMDLGQGTAFALESASLADLHAELAERLHGLIQQKDAARPRFHITVQNKVPPAEARAMQAVLAQDFPKPPFRLPALATHRWDGAAWTFERAFSFRGPA